MASENRKIKNFNKFISSILPGVDIFDYQDKESNIYQHIAYMLDRTNSMFKWQGLPDTIPEYILELYLQVNGNVCFYKYDNNLYIFTGGLGGEPDVYYRPTIYTIANPALKISKSLKIGEECIVVPNDPMYLGLIPLYNRYATAMAETELSLSIATISTRIINLISAPDDRTKESAEKYLSDIIDGKLGVISENAFLDGIKSQPYGNTANSNMLTNLIELEQYYKASWFNDIGLNSNFNMKRAQLNIAESEMNNDSLLPLVDKMLKCRQEYIEKVNEMYGTNISVDFASSWEDNQQEISIEHENLSIQPENDSVKEGDKNEETETPD